MPKENCQLKHMIAGPQRSTAEEQQNVPSGHSVSDLPRNFRVMALIFAGFVTFRCKLPLSMVVVRLARSLWSKPCKKSTGSAKDTETAMPLPVAIGFSSAIASGRLFVLSLLAADLPEAVRALSAKEGLCTIPLTGPPPVELPRLCPCRIISANAMPSSAEDSVMSEERGRIGLVDLEEEAGLEEEVLGEEVTRRRKRFAFSLVFASVALVGILLAVEESASPAQFSAET